MSKCDSTLGITLGDPFGVGAELVLGRPLPDHLAVCLIGSFAHFRAQAETLGRALPKDLEVIAASRQEALRGGEAGQKIFCDIGDESFDAEAARLTQRQRGVLSIRALEVAARMGRFEGPRDSPRRYAVVTCPISKAAVHAAGFEFAGQTEFFSAAWSSKTCMILAGPRLRVGLATNHLALSQVASALSSARIIEKAEICIETLRRHFGIEHPRLAVCGLNPHAGDGGLFGREEETIIQPAIESLQSRFNTTASIAGPVAADTAFYRALNGEFDLVLAMYHDQGLGPLKTVHFDSAVNLSAGLPHLRVSPDHGPAQDIFLKGIARRESFDLAMDLAVGYLRRGVS